VHKYEDIKQKLKTLVDSRCTHTKIDKQLVKEERIKMEPINRLFKVFNADRTKNGEVVLKIQLVSQA